MHEYTNLAEAFFGGYSNVSLHFVFTKLFHQITPYLIGIFHMEYGTYHFVNITNQKFVKLFFWFQFSPPEGHLTPK